MTLGCNNYFIIIQTELAGFYRDADVALVTPLRDGMNLVAKEFVACRFASLINFLCCYKFVTTVVSVEEDIWALWFIFTGTWGLCNTDELIKYCISHMNRKAN